MFKTILIKCKCNSLRHTVSCKIIIYLTCIAIITICSAYKQKYNKYLRARQHTSYTHTCAHRHRHTFTLTHKHHTNADAYLHIYTHSFIHKHIHSLVHICADTHTTHIHTSRAHAASYLPVFTSLNNFVQLRKSVSECKPTFILCHQYLKYMSLCSL